jgi:hypothetical protein
MVLHPKMNIKRYTDSPDSRIGVIQDPNGEYVRFGDHIQIVTSQRNEIDALRDAIGSLKDFINCERRDTQQIAAILNGAIKVSTSGVGTAGT